MATEKMLSELEVAVRLGVSHRTIRRIRDEGKISYTRVGASVQYTEDDVENYLASQRVEAGAKRPRRSTRKAS